VAKGVIEIILRRAKQPLVEVFLGARVLCTGVVGEEFDDDLREVHPFKPDDPTLALALLDVEHQEKIRPSKTL
jgi:hypothetical protein